MPSLSAGFAPGPRHCVHVAQVAGPFGVMTTYAVNELGCLGNDRCCALTVPAVASIMVANDSTMVTGVLIIDVPPCVFVKPSLSRVASVGYLGGCTGSWRSKLL